MQSSNDRPGTDGERAGWDDVAELASASDALFFALRRARAITAGHAGEGLSTAQVTVLEPLLDDLQRPVGQLAASAGVSIPTATRMLKQLEERGLVARTRSTLDDRVVVVSLTEAGRSLLADLRDEMRDRQTLALARFSARERAEFSAYLRRLAAIVSDLDD